MPTDSYPRSARSIAQARVLTAAELTEAIDDLTAMAKFSSPRDGLDYRTVQLALTGLVELKHRRTVNP